MPEVSWFSTRSRRPGETLLLLPLRVLLGGTVLTCLVLPAVAGLQVRPGGSAGLREDRAWPEMQLRGYGRISGTLWSGAKGSVLEIRCEDEVKARLTHAKFLSDLRAVPFGVEQTGDRSIRPAIWRVEGQGVVTALRSGAGVFVLAAGSGADLGELLEHGLAGGVSAAASAAEVEVPMWLDRWDQFGFRFYYRPWELPKDGSGRPVSSYDVRQEFAFAEAAHRSGFVFWANAEQVDTAEGLTNTAWWDFAAREAAARKLPAGLNLMLGGPGMSWFFNRYRCEDAAKMPQYCGTYHGIADRHHGGSGFTSWNSTDGKDANLGLIQSIVRREADRGNLTTILEPHGELKHGDYDIFLEYGPVADASFRAYLREKYRSPAALNLAWGGGVRTWEEVRVPEVASFLGWGGQAIDLSGTWSIAQEPGFDPLRKISSNGPTLPVQAPEEWFRADFDDSAWPELPAPGHDRSMLLPKQPAIYRRTFELPGEWLSKHGQIWIYVWDLNTAWNQAVRVCLNGETAAEDLCRHPASHFLAAEVSSHLRAGRNQVTLRLPTGYLGYRVYLSPEAPAQYPALGPERNARWVDFAGWIGWSRVQAAKRGMEMIRQEQPGVQIDLMAPDGYADGIKELAMEYGGNFKNTGYMGAFWADSLPSLMRGADLPFSLEPGGPADDLPGFKKLMGHYHTEGVQAVDYFIHIGNVLWNPAIRGHFEQTLRLTRMIGKCHPPKAGVAFLWSTGAKNLTGFPWGSDPNTLLPGAWNCKGAGDALLWRGWPRDAVSESDFSNGNAAKYPVIIDTNTSIMDEALLQRVEEYVRGGGTFVTFVQTGRHTPAVPDTWPVSRLTGYEVLSWDRPGPDGGAGGSPSQTVVPAPGQEVYSTPEPWMNRNMTGLRLKRRAADARDLLLWKDGTAAAGMRKLGNGCIVHLGCRDGGAVWMGLAPEAFEGILRWKQVLRTPARLEGEENGKRLLMRHSVTNNGLYDVWSLWNQHGADTVETALVFDDPAVTWGFEVETGKRLRFEPGRLTGLRLEPLQTRLFLTPRCALAQAPRAWFELQRNWWRGAAPPPGEALPLPPHRASVDLSQDWAFRPLAEGEDGAAFSGPDVEDEDWQKLPLTIWSLPDRQEIRQAILRKSFAVPSSWKGGDVELWLQAWQSGTFLDQGRIWLDGTLVRDWKTDGLPGINPGGVLQPGSRHTLAVEIRGKGALAGARGACWLWCWPPSEAALDLAGEWMPSPDAMRLAPPVSLPGRYEALTLRRNVRIPAEQAGKTVMIDVTALGPLEGVLINGRWVRRLHHLIGSRFQLNLTPWVRFGEDNEIELVQREPGRGEIQALQLRCYALGQGYP